MFATDYFDTGDMEVPTFYSARVEAKVEGPNIAYVFCMPVVGVVFGGIHCVRWFYSFPSNNEAIL